MSRESTLGLACGILPGRGWYATLTVADLRCRRDPGQIDSDCGDYVFAKKSDGVLSRMRSKQRECHDNRRDTTIRAIR
jgi:hypothetical protein